MPNTTNQSTQDLHFADACRQLIATVKPYYLADHLFQMQNQLISFGYFEGFTDAARQEHALAIQTLKDFLLQIDNINAEDVR